MTKHAQERKNVMRNNLLKLVSCINLRYNRYEGLEETPVHHQKQLFQNTKIKLHIEKLYMPDTTSTFVAIK